MKDSYFRHLRLYDYVLNNKQLSEVKRLTLNVNQPLIAPSLGDALLLGQEEALPYEDDLEAVKNEIIGQKDKIKAEYKRREAIEMRKTMGFDDDDETLKDEELKNILDSRLRKAKIDKESKLIIHEKLNGLDQTITKTIEEKQK